MTPSAIEPFVILCVCITLSVILYVYDKVAEQWGEIFEELEKKGGYF